MTDVFHVSIREERGTKRARRARAKGQIPAVLYGHGKENVLLAIDEAELNSAIRHGSHFIDLQGGVNESALIKEVQWDAMGIGVVHLDLTRVDKGEKVEVSVPIEQHGFAPGVQQGGVVEQHIHELTIATRADNLPDKIEVNINSLELDQSILVSDLELGEGVVAIDEPDTVVFSCHEPTVVEESTEEGESAEPEVISRSSEDEESDD